MTNDTQPHVVLIGGGTGSFTLLRSLKMQPIRLTALVNMSDDGGSTGVLRDQLGVLPPGDVRQCLVAMSRSPDELRGLFNYRFPEGSDFGGHSFGNLFLSAVEMMTNNFADAVKLAGKVLHIKGRVVPVTLDNRKLVLRMQDGSQVVGQYAIATHPTPSLRGQTIQYDRRARLNPEAAKAIADADLIVIAPGNLYASLIPALAVDGMGASLRRAKARVAYVCNLVNKPVLTKDYTVLDYVNELNRYIGSARITDVLYNTDKPSAAMLKAYALEGELPVPVAPEMFAMASFRAIGGPFLSHQKIKRNKNDTFIVRSLIRHDSEAVTRALMELLP